MVHRNDDDRRARALAHVGGCALSVVQAHCSPRHKTVGVQSGCCVRCGEGEAEENQRVTRGGCRRVEGATVGGDGRPRESERERERITAVSESGYCLQS